MIRNKFLKLHLIAIFCFGYLLNIGSTYHLQHTNAIHQNNRNLFDLRESFYTNRLVKRFNGTWISDAEFYYFTPDNSLNIFNVATGKTQLLVSNYILLQWLGGTTNISPDRKKLLIGYDQETVFRHSTIAKYDIYDIEKDTIHHIADGKKVQYCIWSPTSDTVAYVLDNNVYIERPNGKHMQLTKDGENGIVYNGIPDWVYEEEVLESGGAVWFSPDGSKLAIGVFNDTEVRTYSYVIYGQEENPDYQYPHEVHLKYPKPGTKNPKVQLKVVDLNDISKDAVVLNAPVQTVSKDHILQSVTWSGNNDIVALWLNRRQNRSSLQHCDLLGRCREVTRFEEPKGWIMVENLKCNPSGKTCVLTNWIDEWYQIWNLDLKTGKNLRNSLGPNMTVVKLYGYKEETDEAFYQATLPTDMNQFHVYKNSECISCNVTDPEGNSCRHATALFSKDFSYYALTCQSPTSPPFSKLFETRTQKEILGWEFNNRVRLIIKHKRIPNVRFVQLPLGDGNYAQVKLLLPEDVNLEEEDPKKKYPMIVNVYGGPNSVRVNNAFSTGWDTYMVTNQNVIYAYVDGRGTGNKGKTILYQVNNKLGKYEVEDQIKTAEILRKLFPVIDPERIGIWGWSYGGYVSAMTLARDKNHVFQCGVSVAPVTSWLYYDTIYTERYMGLPTPEDNLENYYLSDVTHDVSNFRNNEFLLIHGTGDDNVHYQQSMQLTKALQQADILFEQMSYPDEDHSIGGATTHLYDTMEEFWIKCLNLTDKSR